MLTTLRGKLVVVFVALIALTTLLGTAFSLWATDTRLALYATAQGQADARSLATLLEARYAFQDGWYDFAPDLTATVTTAITSTMTTTMTTTESDETGWKPQRDWGQLLQSFLALDDTTVQSIRAGQQSWAQVAAARQVAPPVLVQQIWQAERQVIETDILSGVLPLYAYVNNKEAVTTAAYQFIQSAPRPPRRRPGCAMPCARSKGVFCLRIAAAAYSMIVKRRGWGDASPRRSWRSASPFITATKV